VPGTKYTSDFSFALGDAQTPSTAKTTKLKAAGQPKHHARKIRRIFQ
jgi:hypothetical protein